ncbi:MAG: hypothetical protein GTN86_10150 [Xanthomonadales bacterium]|nr:hypothetical protein [Xanthomonadales bacterium]NIN60190.1 hypothetical protein [Xanthomonadales bacterium]NIN75556.1 hypothetical protein [Xanthomonadales bacterium]NIO12847.1 hypothetical protein [Xanthomonadales bacterium]NIP12583.1 hypothetical protein [Xanthomonadales bacterium]
MSEFTAPEDLSAWIANSLASGEHVLATSNQGTILLYRDGAREFVVKTAMGFGPLRRARQATLRREYQAYRRLAGMRGVPACLGLAQGRHLLLEHVQGSPYREVHIPDRAHWFAQLLAIIREFHHRGVAHGDLKSKSNLLVTRDGAPCVLDFGTAVLRKPGFRPLNHRLFAYARQLDLNAWVKHKYHGRYEDAEPADRELLNYSAFESLLRSYRNWRDAR